MKTRLARRAAALLLALALACSLLTIPAAAAERPMVTLEKGKTTTDREELIVDDTVTLTVADADDYEPGKITWEILDGSSYIRLSSSTGRTVTVTTLPLGSFYSAPIRIRAVVEGVGSFGPYVATVVRKPVDVTGITLSESMLKLKTDDSRTLTVNLQPSGAMIQDIKNITWKSDKPSVVSVTPNGLTATIEAKKAGLGTNITVTVEAKNGNTYSQTCIVDVEDNNTTVTITDPASKTLSLPLGATYTLKATVTGNASVVNAGVIWSSSNPAAVNVNSSTGEVKVASNPSYAGASATITARSVASPAYDDICVVYVAADPISSVESVSITSPSTDSYRYVDPGSTITLTAAVDPSDATATIIWSSDNTSVAKVNQNTGVVTGVAAGKAIITAQVAGTTITATREIETSGIVLSYRPSGSSDTVSLAKGKAENLYQYHDMTVIATAYGNAKGKRVTLSTSNTSVAGVDGLRVTATYPGEAEITAMVEGTGFTASFNVKVAEDVADAIIVTMGSSASYSFSGLLSQLDSRSKSKAGGPLESVSSLKVSTENGVLYHGYTSPNSPGRGVGGSERYYYQPVGSNQLALKDVSFVPLPGFDGTAIVEYNGTATNGTTFNGTIRIQATASGDVSYTTEKNQPVSFSAEHFSAICMSRNGQSVRYINFSQPTASRGTLYYNYSPTGQYSPKVVSSTNYYVSSNPSIDNITFVPAKDFTGSVDIPYRCTDSSGAVYIGTITVTVSSADGTTTTGDVEYSIARNQRQSLRTNDFASFCQRTIGGTLNYIRFTDLPSSSAGILYLNYTSSSSARVATNRNYFRNSSPYISEISFVPASGYSGTVSIPFTATNTSGENSSGTLVFHVDDGVGTVHYSTPRNQNVSFYAEDFNDASYRINNASLNYVRFTSLPSSSSGTLYLNYRNSSSTKVTTDRSYYRNSSPSLSNITFVPASGYNGTVTIPFTAYDSSGSTFNGTVTIAVGSAGRQTVSYSTVPNGVVRFSGADFNSACLDATGYSLNYVRFNSPGSYYGTLYYQYNISTRVGISIGSGVDSGTNYYYSGSSSRLINDVSFVASSAIGTFSLGYTGYDTNGSSFSGTVEIHISGGSTVTGTTSIRYTGSSTPVAFRASDFQDVCQMRLSNPLSYVQFTTLPAVGHLNQNYSSSTRTGAGVNSLTHYDTLGLDQISYLPKAEYQGTVFIPYTLYDTQGGSYSSSVEIQLSNAYNNSSFSDISSSYWASPSIEYLRHSGITNGYSNNTYRPAQSISRGEFTLMICRAFQFPTTGSSGFPDVPANSTYAGAIASARNLGIVEGNNGRFQPENPITRQSAMTMICRAMEAAGQALPVADTNLLSSYSDGWQVSAFARSSVAALVNIGVVRGDSATRLNPTAAISRAEMAVILHRVLSR